MNMNRTIRVDPRKGADRETPILNFASAQKEVESLLVIHPATQEDKVSCVGRGIKLLKKLKEVAYFKKDNREDALKLAKDVLLYLSSFGLTSDDERSKSLVRILDHYRVSLLGDDKALVDWFDRARLEYSKDPENQGVSINFGWILHDCIKTAIRLRNAKLIRYFLDEFERWEYHGEVNESVEKLKDCRKKDLIDARAFLTGPIDSIVYMSKGECENALRSAEVFLKRNPRNELAYRIALRACWNLKNHQKGLLLCVEAIKCVPDHKDFQRKFIHVIWGVYKEFLNNSAIESQARLMGLCPLLQTIDEVFSLLGDIAPKSKDYSSLLTVATKICTTVCTTPLKKTADASLYKERAILNYISFVKKWNLDNLTADDKADRFANGRRYSSLSANVVLALLKCVVNGNANAIVSADPWIMEFASDNGKLFSFGRSDYFLGMANVWFSLGDMEESRAYAMKLVRDNQADGWRWRVLARTYPKDSQERNDCLSRANTFKQREVNKMFRALFDESEVSSDQLEDAKVESVQRKTVQDSRAEALLTEDAMRYDGIVLTRFCDKRKQGKQREALDDRTSLRVWWRDWCGHENTDFVSLANFEGINAFFIGAPVQVFVVDDCDRVKVVKVVPRSEGKPFDIYPYRIGVVVERKESRHTLSVMYEGGKCFPVNMKRLSSKDAFQIGEVCRIAVLERTGMAPLFLDIKEAEDDDIMPPFVKDFEGVLTRKPGSRDAYVGEVIVPSGAYSREMIDKKVCGTAALFFTKTGTRIWRAVTMSTILKNLEVRP